LGSGIELIKTAGEFKLEEIVPLIGVISAIAFAIREWRSSAFEKNWEFSTELQREWNSHEMKIARAEVARLALQRHRANQSVGLEDMLSEHAALEILNFFEDLGYLVRKKAVWKEIAWIMFYEYLRTFRPVLMSLVNHYRGNPDDKDYDGTFYEEFEKLGILLDKHDQKKTKSESTFELDPDALAEELHILPRHVKNSDFHQLVALERHCFSETEGRFDEKDLTDYLEGNSQRFLILENVLGELVGYALFTKYDAKAPDAEHHYEDDIQTFEIISIAILPLYRGLGLAKKMLEYIEKTAQEQGAQRMVLEVSELKGEAYSMYQRAGYAEKKKLENYYAEGKHAFFMEKLF
jgi:ribosomal protein S18 acetylase RimI-like enzyme